MKIDPEIKASLRHLPSVPGVYLFKDGQGSVIYVGKAKNLRLRVRSYFQRRGQQDFSRPKILVMLRHVRRVETLTVRTEAEALILEGRLLKEYKPKYNTAFVDDKKFLLVRVTADPLPRFILTRNRVDPQSSYYGPFVNGRAVAKLFQELRRRYGILLGDATPQELPDGRWQLYSDARGQIYDHPNLVTRSEYLERVARASAFLEGQSRLWRQEVAQKMAEASQAHRYEEAAKWRDLLTAITAARNPHRKFLRDPLLKVLDAPSALSSLQEALQMDRLPACIECFDISHISGSFVVASLVRFQDGLPAKGAYKRFRIRGDELLGASNNDFAAMREVVGRHYTRLVQEHGALPDLVVIDGGAGQLKSALAAFLEHGLPPPMMIGLAKRDETFVFSDGRPPLTLPRAHLGLRLLQRVRDEAHRVANSFNAQLRSRALQTSVLDECPGIGPQRRAALLERFPTLSALRRASVARLAAIIGPRQAQVVRNYLLEKHSPVR